MAKITEEVKATRLLWIEALESGKYKQFVDGELFRNNSYCCLGIFCSIMPKKFSTYQEDGEEELNSNALNLLGMTTKQQADAIDMNDTKKKTFLEIATYFRKLWKIPSGS